MVDLTTRTAFQAQSPVVGPTPADGSLPRQRALLLLDLVADDEVPGIAGVLARLCRALTHDLALGGATVTLVPGLKCHSVTAASSSATRRIEELQFDAGEGPSRHSFLSGEPVVVTSLVAATGRWPSFAPAAVAAGVRSVAALPLRVGAATLGALTLYWEGRSGPTYDELRSAMVFADLATELLVDSSYAAGRAELDPGLRTALDAHEHVYQAQGMVMVALGVGLPEALARMRAHAFASNQDLESVARRIIAGERVLERDPR